MFSYSTRLHPFPRYKFRVSAFRARDSGPEHATDVDDNYDDEE